MSGTAWTVLEMLDVVIGVTLAEAVILWIYHRRTGKGIAPPDLALTLLSGLLLMLAFRAHLAGQFWLVTTSLLAGGGICHALDLRRRWQPTGRQKPVIRQPSDS